MVRLSDERIYLTEEWFVVFAFSARRSEWDASEPYPDAYVHAVVMLFRRWLHSKFPQNATTCNPLFKMQPVAPYRTGTGCIGIKIRLLPSFLFRKKEV
jgi:hypothetical protein